MKDKVYVGPAYGLPSVVGELHYKHKKVAEEMMKLTQSLKEQTAAAGTIIRGDIGWLQQSSVMAENNLDKLGVEAKRVA